MLETTDQPGLGHAMGLYLGGIRDGHPREALDQHTGARYVQHSTGVPDGKEGFLEFFGSFLARNPQREIELIRGWQDGRHVFVHAYQSLNGGEAKWVTADFFDTDEEGKLVEHWDVIAPFVGGTASGRTNIDGATEITDLHLSEDNKQVVREMITNLLMRDGDASAPERYIAREYAQHNPEVPDGLAPFAELLAAPSRPLWYERIVLLVGRGNFVATLCETTWDGVRQAQADVFRLEGGLIVEHWDAVEPCPPQDELVNGGKF